MTKSTMKRFVQKSVMGTCCLVFFVCNSISQPREQVFTGARPLGMGETFVAIAEDGNTLYWNPAGLPTLRRFEFSSTYGSLYGIGLKNGFLSFALPITPRFGTGATWFHTGFGDDELEFSRNIVNLSAGAKVYKSLFLGANLKYLTTDTKLEGLSLGQAETFGFDLGALLSLPVKNSDLLRQINLGIMAHDVRGTKIKFDDTSHAETILPQNIRLGLAFFPKEEISLKWFSLKKAVLAFDLDDRFHVGAETWVSDHLALRAGLQKDRDKRQDEGLTYAFGSSLRFKSLQLDYAYSIPPVLPPTHLFSFSFTRSPSPAKITDIRLVNDNLFASLYKTYKNTPVGYAIVRNDSDQEVDATIKISIPGLSEGFTQESFRLIPNEIKSAYFSAVLSKVILDVQGRDTRQVKARLEYKIRNEDKVDERTQKFQLLGRGAITWDDPGKAAAFITKQDRMVQLFADQVTNIIPYRPEIKLGKIYEAVCLFDAMSAVGIRYGDDPTFAKIPKNQHAVDQVKYPAELLIHKRGDCDDLTVLYASLLEYSGISTALISTAKHITLMFDTGIHERNWGLLPLTGSPGSPLIVLKNKSVWIPIEVTKIGTSFAEAWEEGGKRYYNEWRHDKDFNVTLVSEVENIYPSAEPESLQNKQPDLPDFKRLRKMVEQDSTRIQQNRMNHAIERYLSGIRTRSDSLLLRNKLGIVFAQQDSITRAEEQFRTILQRQPNDTDALINLANIYCMYDSFEEAAKHYLKAEKQLKDEPGVYLNLAILYQLWGIAISDSMKYQGPSEENLERAYKLLNGNDPAALALDLLGISFEVPLFENKAETGPDKKTKSGIIKFIKDSADKYVLNRRSVKGVRLEGKVVKRGQDNDRGYILWWTHNGRTI
ncbi:MAG: PorV/PorQ family protein [bacterium]